MKQFILKTIDSLLLSVIITSLFLFVFGLNRNGIITSCLISAAIIGIIAYLWRERKGYLVLSVFKMNQDYETINTMVRGGTNALLSVGNLTPKEQDFELNVSDRKNKSKRDLWKYHVSIVGILVCLSATLFLVVPSPEKTVLYSKHLINNPNWVCDVFETKCTYEFQIDDEDASLYFAPRGEEITFWIYNIDENQSTYRHEYDINNKTIKIYFEATKYECDVDELVVTCDQALQSDDHIKYLELFLIEIETAKEK